MAWINPKTTWVSELVADADMNRIEGNILHLYNNKLGTTGKAADSELLDGLNSTQFAKSNTTGADLNTVVESGMYRIEANANRPTGSDYGQLLVVHGGADTIMQLVTGYAGAGIWFRVGNPPAVGGAGAWTQWFSLWNSGNDGAGSGLDADTVDGVNAYATHQASGSWIPVLSSGGILEIGRYLDFHFAGSVTDFDSRFWMDAYKRPTWSVDGGDYKMFHKGNYGKPWQVSSSILLNDLSWEDGVFYITGETSKVVTIPSDAVCNYAIGTVMVFINWYNSPTTIAPYDGNVTIISKDNKRTLNGNYAWATAIKIGSNQWHLGGDLKA